MITAMSRKNVIYTLAMLVAVGMIAGVAVAAAQGPPEDAGPPDNVTVGPPDNVTTGPPENVTTGPSDNVTVGPPDGVAKFLNTSPLHPSQVDPNSLAGKIRVESQHVDNTTIELVNANATETEINITVTGNATNVTFYLQKQAVEASQDIDNITMKVDGQPAEFGANQSKGGNWIVFEIEHFSTRTVTFESVSDSKIPDDSQTGAPDYVDNYRNSQGKVDLAGLQSGIKDFVQGGLDLNGLQNVIDAFVAN